MTTTGKIVLGCAAAGVVIAAAAVKWIFFPAIKDDYFTMNQRSFRRVPAGIVFLRATHFPDSPRKGLFYDSVQVSGRRVLRMMGRDVTLKELVAAAYGRNAARVVLPATAPKENFDFLITVASNQQERLQKLIRKKLGYVAKAEQMEEPVLVLSIKNGALPGLTVSAADSRPNADFKNGKIYFTHMRPQSLTASLEQALEKPVVDRTGLTNFYDFSANWDAQTQRQLRSAATAADTVKKILGAWGLGLEPDTDQVEVLAVKSAG
jgi:uncharacterized protein (TIGR03435 family)